MQALLHAVAGIAPTLVMIAVFALAAGGIHLIRTRRDRRKGVLMLVAAAVFLGNLLIWMV